MKFARTIDFCEAPLELGSMRKNLESRGYHGEQSTGIGSESDKRTAFMRDDSEALALGIAAATLEAEGITEPTREELARLDRKRPKKGSTEELFTMDRSGRSRWTVFRTYLTGGRYLVYAKALTADAPTARLTVRCLAAAGSSARQDQPTEPTRHADEPRRRCSGTTPVRSID